MPALRFIHSSDLHLGRRFLNIPEPPDGNLRGRLMEARFDQIHHLAEAARQHRANHILLAGDTFDSSTPSPQVLRQALAAMRDETDVTWWLLPGNHDNMRNAEPVWETIRKDAPENIQALLDSEPVELAPDAMLLPCPVPVRSSGRDLTEALPRIETPEGVLRIGLAHGGVVDFSESGEQIPPDRDRTAALDYLALGDWHGRLGVSARTHYSGSPEQDQFKHNRRGCCLAITIPGRGLEPEVAEIETGSFLWEDVGLALHEGEDAAAALEALLPDSERRNTLMRIKATGWASLSEHAALRGAAERHAPEFAFLDCQSDDLGTLHSVSDLDEIDHAGAMRLAADQLMAEAADMALSEEDRTIAAAALNRLYAYAKETSK
ncbi:DNA double-strand break repair protein Mre11 [Roseibacterium elongatum DSM 19469]|uniref:DNA double-strand break repair protein Mre11 n=1 Tax=Roseicyclus elongatus DSM 19469 TaxID=1294273 RepID=W8STA1_9RHOB|nr:DNA repair exonuclease [Roseibacterium elongatum]AHM05755.1 DNA double-strand break repair protein Mre11 [Roseibacterium elongatum DSM 19469]